MRPKHLKALAWAVSEAEGWRGSLIGGPDYVLAEFDAKVAAAKEALRELRRAKAAEKRPKAEYEKH